MWMVSPPSGLFQYLKKLFLTEQAGRAQAVDFLRQNVANSLSMANLVMGLSSILCSLNGLYHHACWLVLVGFLLDLADGAVARQLNACSALGAKLDDFADFTTFGSDLVEQNLLFNVSFFNWEKKLFTLFSKQLLHQALKQKLVFRLQHQVNFLS